MMSHFRFVEIPLKWPLTLILPLETASDEFFFVFLGIALSLNLALAIASDDVSLQKEMPSNKHLGFSFAPEMTHFRGFLPTT